MEARTKAKLALIGFTVLASGVAVTQTLPRSSAQKIKAAFLSPAEVDFIRPGLVLDVLSVAIDTDNTVRYRFRITDPRGVPLEREGNVTPGPVSISQVLAYIPKGTGIYTSYTTRTQVSPINGERAIQASADTGGTYTKISDGVYEYKFGTKLPADYDKTATHTIAAWASRNLSEFSLSNNYAAKTYNWVPSGATVTETRHITSNEKCNSCHGQVVAHGSRTTVELCVVCHTPQTTDPDTGNTVDMTTMVHKIHRGSSLPSVVAGTPYVIIGNGQSVHDFSSVVFPADVRTCNSCHLEGATGDQHLTNPSRRACGSCHDNVNFATGANHAGGLPQLSDTQCSRCHIPKGEIDFDASISGAHVIAERSTALPGMQFQILDVRNTAPGQKPAVTFKVADKDGNPVTIAGIGRLALVLAGPTGDHVDNDTAITEDARNAPGSNGVYTYQFNAAIPAGAMHTWAVGIEGYRNQTLLPGTVVATAVRDAGKNVVSYFSVDGEAVTPRRKIVTTEKCNVCHASLSLHGGSRNQIEQCVLCHNPTATDVARRPAAAGAPESVNFKELIHRIHTGEDNSRTMSVYGFGGTAINFNEVRYPRSRSECVACHVNGSEQLPLPEKLMSATDPRGLLNPAPPATGACLSCHNSTWAAAHADSNISPRLGESCAACHGSGAQFAVDKIHAR